MEYQWFSAEYAKKGTDFVFHFFPPNEEKLFAHSFAKMLERAFMEVLPLDADVRAGYLTVEESMVVLRYDEDPTKTPERGRETYSVNVKHVANMPGAEYMLHRKVFVTLDNLMSLRGAA